ncbi:MAG: alpha/beta hydrolase [Lachnospiraceae bacterium]|nr:alpha/beta hydrolase [Lachnospiraceae bacterium]
MGIGKWLAGAAAAGTAGAAGEYALARYFVRRTLIRGNAKTERTQKMAGVDWSIYFPMIQAAKDKILENPSEDVYLTSRDGLKLYGQFFPQAGSKRVALCFHGYTSQSFSDYAVVAAKYWEQGFSLLCVDERGHGKSEGTYIGFGCLDRYDALGWIEYLVERLGEDCQILLHGDSMGGATVLMTSGLSLPPQVKGIVSDCAFTSAWEVFTHVLKSTYHLPAFPLMQISDIIARKEAGYGLDECNAREEVKKSHVPTLFIHGEKDSFVPCSMVYELYEACAAPKELLVVKGAAHVESYYKAPEQYGAMVQTWIDRYFQ